MQARASSSSKFPTSLALPLCAVYIACHIPYLGAPYFWDEVGQFLPTALDIFYSGLLVAHSTIPNIHPPGMVAYLAGVWKLFGYSIPATRLAMLAITLAGCWAVYRLAVEYLCPDRRAAVMTLVLLGLSPLLFSQGMMAQLDMPSMTLGVLAILFFLREKLAASIAMCAVLVMVKETGLLVPAVLGACLLLERRWREALWFGIPAIPLLAWLELLHSRTGYWGGSATFAQYNLFYPLHPVRLVLALVRRLYYLFVGTCYFLGAFALWRQKDRSWLQTRAWRLVGVFTVLHVISMCVLGGAVLERYLLPVLPFTLAAFANALCALAPRWRNLVFTAMCAGSTACIWVNPIYPFPLENNVAWTDYTEAQRDAAQYLAAHMQPDDIVVTAFPFGGCLRRTEYGYTARRVRIDEIPDLTARSMARLCNHRVDYLVEFTSVWDPLGIMDHPGWIAFLERFYNYVPDARPEQVPDLARRLHFAAKFQRRGQWVEIWSREPQSF